MIKLQYTHRPSERHGLNLETVTPRLSVISREVVRNGGRDYRHA
ncbi:MAG: hypothetical protein OXC54_01090 [Rhodospirillaceae bacterium]|nr:hypothetical protein [Rhodospirillaceae bacterium]